jgi:hypothetical protein
MRLTKLPAWVVPNDISVEQEVAEFRDMPIAEKARIRAGLSRSLARMLAQRGDPTLYDASDPLPESTIAALKRLRMARS